MHRSRIHVYISLIAHQVDQQQRREARASCQSAPGAASGRAHATRSPDSESEADQEAFKPGTSDCGDCAKPACCSTFRQSRLQCTCSYSVGCLCPTHCEAERRREASWRTCVIIASISVRSLRSAAFRLNASRLFIRAVVRCSKSGWCSVLLGGLFFSGTWRQSLRALATLWPAAL